MRGIDSHYSCAPRMPGTFYAQRIPTVLRFASRSPLASVDGLGTSLAHCLNDVERVPRLCRWQSRFADRFPARARDGVRHRETHEDDVVVELVLLRAVLGRDGCRGVRRAFGN